MMDKSTNKKRLKNLVQDWSRSKPTNPLLILENSDFFIYSLTTPYRNTRNPQNTVSRSFVVTASPILKTKPENSTKVYAFADDDDWDTKKRKWPLTTGCHQLHRLATTSCHQPVRLLTTSYYKSYYFQIIKFKIF